MSDEEFRGKLNILVNETGMTTSAICEVLDIPRITFTRWKTGTSKPPKYFYKMILMAVANLIED